MNRFGHYPSSTGELHSCWLSWNQDKQNQRFGQWMINNYLHDGKPWPEMFYEENDMSSYNIIFHHINDSIWNS